ncbi:MAG: hypothetical protein HYX78_12375 [Armatimonadetes bacterium]|nr:hypothetical protein [Armatimonadota bacterium]
MKGRLIPFYLLAVCCLVAAPAVTAQESVPDVLATGISTAMDLAYVSKYIWRGISLNPDPAYQPSLTVSHPTGLSFNFWASADTTDVSGNSGEFTEIDYTLSYDWTAKSGHAMNAGIVSYTFPNTSASNTTEVFGSMCFGGNLSPTLAINYDFDEADGFYASFGTSYECPMPWKQKAPAMGFAARVGYGSSGHNGFNYGAETSALTDFLIGVSLPIQIGEKVSMVPSVTYTRVIDGELRDALSAAGSDSTNFFAGLTVSSSF